MARKTLQQILALLSLTILLCQAASGAAGDRLQSLVSVSGAPDNQLVGYGLVVGLPGTGDRTTQIPYTKQSITNLLERMGIRLQGNSLVQPRDVAAVMVTAQTPPYMHAGQHINVTVSALGNAKSINGGVLLPTPLKGGNGSVYAQAQGAVLVSGYQVSAAGSSSRTNIPTVGQIPNGGIMADGIAAHFAQNGITRLLLNRPNFTTAARIARTIEQHFGDGAARAVSPSVVEVPNGGRGDVAYMSKLMNLRVEPGKTPPKVVIDAQSGTIVMGAGVKLGPAVVSHGNLTVRVQARNGVSQPAPLSNGQTVGVTNARVAATQGKAHVVNVPQASSLGAVTRALNAIGAKPADLIAIVQALKKAGALKAHLKVM